MPIFFSGKRKDSQAQAMLCLFKIKCKYILNSSLGEEESSTTPSLLAWPVSVRDPPLTRSPKAPGPASQTAQRPQNPRHGNALPGVFVSRGGWL